VNTKLFKIEKIQNIKISENSKVRVFKCGNVLEVKWLQKINTKPTVRKINNDLYMKVRTGEVFEYERKDFEGNRTDNIKNVKRSLSELRRIINYNVVDVSKARWLTLTYKENMKDTKRLYDDVRKFLMRLKYYYKDYNIEYINVVEPQGRGAWHCHLMLIFDKTAPFIKNDELSKLWGFGFVSVKSLDDDVDNIGAYLSAYLSDISFDDAQALGMIKKGVTIEQLGGDGVKEVKGKKYLKGFRMRLYPTGLNIYRTSRGIKKPSVTAMTEGECANIRGSASLTFESTIQIQDNDFSNIINTRYYNFKR
jgi:hypothetical protein